MTVIRALAKLYNSNNRPRDAVLLYEEARQHYLSQPQTKKPDGDIDTPFDWYTSPHVQSSINTRNELNILLGLLPKTGDPMQAIRLIHTTSRWLRGRSEERFWDEFGDSREWDEDHSRRIKVKGYDAGKWDISRYALPIEIRVRLGIQYLLAKNLPEALVPSLPFSRICLPLRGFTLY